MIHLAIESCFTERNNIDQHLVAVFENFHVALEEFEPSEAYLAPPPSFIFVPK